jgi:hypothetical protein
MRLGRALLVLVVPAFAALAGCELIAGTRDITEGEGGGADDANGDSPGTNSDALGAGDTAVPIGDSALTDTTSGGDARSNSDATVTETGSDGAGTEAGPGTDAQMDGGSNQEAAPDAAMVDANYPYELIDDMQANSGQIAIKNGRNGYWFTYGGTDGGTETPASGGTFTDGTISPARSVTGVFATIIGATTSTYGAEVTGSGFNKYGGMGFNFKNPRAAYNASAYTGFVFWGRIGSSTTAATIRFLVSDAHTDSQGGTCSMCSDYLAMDLTFTTTWQQFTVNYSDLSQAGFGVPAETTLDAAAVYGVQFQVSTTAPAGQAFDVWIDDIYFIKP